MPSLYCAAGSGVSGFLDARLLSSASSSSSSLFETGSYYVVLPGLEFVYVDEAGFELMEICMPLPSEFWD